MYTKHFFYFTLISLLFLFSCGSDDSENSINQTPSEVVKILKKESLNKYENSKKDYIIENQFFFKSNKLTKIVSKHSEIYLDKTETKAFENFFTYSNDKLNTMYYFEDYMGKPNTKVVFNYKYNNNQLVEIILEDDSEGTLKEKQKNIIIYYKDGKIKENNSYLISNNSNKPVEKLTYNYENGILKSLTKDEYFYENQFYTTTSNNLIFDTKNSPNKFTYKYFGFYVNNLGNNNLISYSETKNGKIINYINEITYDKDNYPTNIKSYKIEDGVKILDSESFFEYY